MTSTHRTISAAMVFGVGLLPALAHAESRTIEATAFTGVEISSGINADISIGDVLAVTADAPSADRLNELKYDVKDGHLRAWVDWSLWDLLPFDSQQITLHITVPAIDFVAASSGADITVAGVSGDKVWLEASSGAGIDAKDGAGKAYTIQSSSGAQVTVSGTCDNAEIESSSGAGINASDLKCADVVAESSSGAGAEVFASASIKAEASSGADITVHGNPAKIEDDASSGADITYAD